jgi:predicted secreted Zn-dependent protease
MNLPTWKRRETAGKNDRLLYKQYVADIKNLQIGCTKL